MTAEPVEPSLGVRIKTRLERLSQRLLSASRWMAGGAFGTLAVLSAIYPTAGTMPGPVMPFFGVALLALFAAPVVWLSGSLVRLTPFREASVTASPAGLEVTRDGVVQTIPASSITFAVVEPGSMGAKLCLWLTNGDELVLKVPSVTAGDALVARLALDPNQRRTDVTWNPLWRRLGAGLAGYYVPAMSLGVLVGALQGTAMVVPLVFLTAIVPFLVASWAARSMRNQVSVGRAGVVARDARKTQQLGFDDVLEVRHEGETVQLIRDGAEPFVVSLKGLDDAVAKQLVTRIRQGLRAFGDLLGSRAEIFARGERDFETWKTEVRRVLTEAVGFRGAALLPEDALRVVEDPDADPEARVGAALALMEVGNDDQKLRVRVAADTTLAPRVRIALEAASEGDVQEHVIAAAVREREV